MQPGCRVRPRTLGEHWVTVLPLQSWWSVLHGSQEATAAGQGGAQRCRLGPNTWGAQRGVHDTGAGMQLVLGGGWHNS